MKDEEEPQAVSVTGSQGVQVGPGNQYNMWAPKPPLDPVAMAALSPHRAVDRLQQLSHDELLDFFARAKPDDVSEIFAVFLETDEAKVVATLADVNHRRAIELLNTVCVQEILTMLPKAAQEIARKAASLKWNDAGLLERFSTGYARRYKNGCVFWAEGIGARVTTTEIDDYCKASGSRWGVPISDRESVPKSRFGTEGVRQKFQVGTVYLSVDGIYRVVDDHFYEDEGGSGGWLGFPIGEIASNPGFWRLQRFEGGTIYFYIEGGPTAFTVRREVTQALSGKIFCPISKESATQSSFGTSGTIQCIEIRLGHDTYKTAVYSSEEQDVDVVAVAPEVWNYYRELGGESSWLGFPSHSPTSGATVTVPSWQKPVTVPSWLNSMSRPTELSTPSPKPTPTAGAVPRAVPRAVPEAVQRAAPIPREFPEPDPKLPVFQHFEGGIICWRPGTDAFAVSSAISETIAEVPAFRVKLGWPVSEERPIGPGEVDRIQFFENGNVTVRDGKCEIWLRPASQEPARPEDTRPNF